MRPRRLALAAALLLGSLGVARANPEGPEAVLEALEAVLPDGAPPLGLRPLGELGTGLAFGAPLRAARLAARGLDAPRVRLEEQGTALAADTRTAAAGPLHRQLELRQIELGDARGVLSRVAEALEQAAHELEPSLGSGALRPALALEELLRQADGDLLTMARVVRGAAEELDRTRRAVDRMLALVEEVQDRSTSASRERVILAGRPGTPERLSRGLLAAGSWLAAAKRSLADAQGLIRIRYLSLLEALRNLRAKPGDPVGKDPALAGLEVSRDRLAVIRTALVGRLASAEASISELEAGREAPPEIPALPGWLFGAGQTALATPGDTGSSSAREEALDLLDEIEGDLDRETVLLDDPLSAGLAATFNARHGLDEHRPAGAGGDPVAAQLAGLLRERQEWPGPGVGGEAGPDLGLSTQALEDLLDRTGQE